MAEILKKLKEFDKNWLMAVLSSMGDGVISMDENGVIGFVNHKACEILEKDMSSLLEKQIDDVILIKNERLPGNRTFEEWIAHEPHGEGGVPKNSYISTPNCSKKYISLHHSQIQYDDKECKGSVLIIRDISKIVEAERKAIVERDNMTTMFYELPIGMIIIDSSLRIVKVNQSFLDMMGLHESNTIGSVLGDAFGCIWSFENGCGHNKQCLYCKLRNQIGAFIKVGTSFKNFMTELKYLSLGEPKSSWVNLCFLPTQVGNEIHYLITIEDHSERIAYERKLNEARNTNMTILNSLPVMIFRLNNLMKCNFINDTFKSFFNIEEFSEFAELQNKMPNEDYDVFTKVIYKNFLNKKNFSLEINVFNTQNELRHMLLLGSPMYDINRHAIGILGVILDVHDEKVSEILYRQSQRKYFSLFQNMESSVSYYNLIHDTDGKVFDAEIIECNQATSRILKLDAKKIIGTRLSEIGFLSEQEIKKLLIRFEKVIQSGESYHLKELYLVSLDRWIEIAIYSPEQNYVAMLVTDIDGMKRTEIALFKEKERSEEANRVKSEFLANMSHEIRTPLNGIVGMIDLSLMEPLSEDQNDNLLTAKECVTSLIDIINDILDFSKIEAGKLKIESVAFDLTDLVENTLKIHIPHLNEKDLELKVDLTEIIQNQVLGDAKRIKQIINNLVSNAIKFTDQGHVMVKVTQRLGVEENKVLTTFKVIDTGIGIELSKQNLLFNSFTQIDGSYTRKYGGTGLGLIISKQLVEMMSGTISFQSELNVGSTFEFVLPLESAKIESEIISQNEAMSLVYDGKQILLVEDDRVNQIVMEKMIEREGIKVTIAENGLEALNACNVREFDLILMDIQMPIMDGIESTRQIRTSSGLNRLTPIVALTAFALRGDEEIFKASGMDGYISKPVDRNNLMNLLSEMLTNPKINSANFMKNAVNSFSFEVPKDEEPLRPTILNKETVFELKHRIRQLYHAHRIEDYLVLEVNAHQLKVRFEALKIEELKNIAFKIELELRKERYDKVSTLIEQLQKIMDGFSQSEEDLDE